MDISLDYIAPKSKSTVRAQSQYAALYSTVEGEEELQKQETGDDLRLTATHIHCCRLVTGKPSVMPLGKP